MKNKVIVLGNTAEWCDKSWLDLKNISGCKVINKHFPCNNYVLEKLIRIHYSEKVNRIIKLPMKLIWYKFFLKHIVENYDEDVILIIYDGNKLGNDEQFLRYLKHKCNNIRMVYIITNEVQYSIASRNHFFDKLKDLYDIIYGFHLPDSKKYGINVIPLVYSLNEVKHNETQKIVFFAGEAKKRLNRIMKICEKIESLGFKSKIIALHVDEDAIKEAENLNGDIVFNKYVPYEDIIRYIQESAAIIEVPQDGLKAITIKTCEAIFYNKLLITTNPLILDMPFYDPKYMLYIENENDIKEEFLENWDKVKYKKESRDFFSVETFLHRLEKDLKREKNGK